MNRKYTTGPWLISTIDGEDTLMVGGGDGSDVVADIRTDRKEMEVEANAHLIAAAPELLETLEAVENDCMDRGDCLLWTTLGTKIRNAIAHAEGRDASND